MNILEGVKAVWESTGLEYVGVEPGGIDFVEVIEAGLQLAGPCDLAVCTGGVNDKSVRRLVDNPRRRRLRVIVSHELATMNRKASTRVAGILGAAERGIRGHVKAVDDRLLEVRAVELGRMRTAGEVPRWATKKAAK